MQQLVARAGIVDVEQTAPRPFMKAPGRQEHERDNTQSNHEHHWWASMGPGRIVDRNNQNLDCCRKLQGLGFRAKASHLIDNKLPKNSSYGH